MKALLAALVTVIGVITAQFSHLIPSDLDPKLPERETFRRSNAAQLVNAIDRYVAVNETYPWEGEVSDTFYQDQEDLNLAFQVSTSWLNELIASEEIKAKVIQDIVDYQYRVYKPASTPDDGIPLVFVCFLPEMSSWKQEAQERCFEPDYQSKLGDHYKDLCASGKEYSCVPAPQGY